MCRVRPGPAQPQAENAFYIFKVVQNEAKPSQTKEECVAETLVGP